MLGSMYIDMTVVCREFRGGPVEVVQGRPVKSVDMLVVWEGFLSVMAMRWRISDRGHFLSLEKYNVNLAGSIVYLVRVLPCAGQFGDA